VEILRESKATGVKLVRSPAGKLFVGTEGEILLDTKVLSWAEIRLRRPLPNVARDDNQTTAHLKVFHRESCGFSQSTSEAL
jgi:hypothetical protein